MERYQVVYIFINLNGAEKEDFIDNNGQGFTLKEAKMVCRHLQQRSAVKTYSVFVIPM